MLALREVDKNFFKPNPNAPHLNEIYDAGDNMPEYALLGPTGDQVGSWMKCKDYIQDAYWGQRHGIAYSIYGWDFDPTKNKVSNRYLLLAVRWKGKSDAELSNCLKNSKKTIERLESRVKIPKYRRTRFSPVIDGMFIVWGSPDWLRAIATLSFFTCILRASFLNEKGTLDIKNAPNMKDLYYLKSGKPFIEEMKKSGLKAFKPDWDDYGEKGQAPKASAVGRVHGNGFVHWSNGKGEGEEDYDDNDEDWGA
jgi:hypothetical protein